MKFTRRTKTAGLLIFLALILSFTVFLFEYNAGLDPQKKSTPSKTASEEDKRNMFMQESERARAEADFNAKVGLQNNTKMIKNHKFTYTLSPEFEKRLKTIQTTTQKNVLGASNVCNLGTIPDVSYVFDLKSHWLVGDSKRLATEYGVNSISYSMLTETIAFQYLFITPDNSSFFTQYEPSGVYTFNKPSLVAGTLSASALRQKADQVLASHKLDENIDPPTSRMAGDTTFFTFRKNLPDYPLVDEASIQSFFDKENCSVTDSDIMGLVDVGVNRDGTLVRLVNNTRTIAAAHKVRTILFNDARQEYADTQPIDPIIFPADADLGPNPAVVFDAAIIAYYDVGLNFGQDLYVPIYVAHGFTKSITGQDAQILTFFPAVSVDDLLGQGILDVPESGDKNTQQQGVLPFATPSPAQPPLYPTSSPDNQYAGPGCPGKSIQYLVSCSVDGSVICRGNLTTASSSDGMNVCAGGCRMPVGVVDVTAGTNPCDAFIKQNGIPATNVTPGIPRQRIAPKGKVICVINACPS